MRVESKRLDTTAPVCVSLLLGFTLWFRIDSILYESIFDTHDRFVNLSPILPSRTEPAPTEPNVMNSLIHCPCIARCRRSVSSSNSCSTRSGASRRSSRSSPLSSRRATSRGSARAPPLRVRSPLSTRRVRRARCVRSSCTLHSIVIMFKKGASNNNVKNLRRTSPCPAISENLRSGDELV